MFISLNGLLMIQINFIANQEHLGNLTLRKWGRNFLDQ